LFRFFALLLVVDPWPALRVYFSKSYSLYVFCGLTNGAAYERIPSSTACLQNIVPFRLRWIEVKNEVISQTKYELEKIEHEKNCNHTRHRMAGQANRKRQSRK